MTFADFGGFAGVFFLSRFRRAASATDESSCDCASCACANAAAGKEITAPRSVAMIRGKLNRRIRVDPRQTPGEVQDTPGLLPRQSPKRLLCESDNWPSSGNARTSPCVLKSRDLGCRLHPCGDKELQPRVSERIRPRPKAPRAGKEWMRQARCVFLTM